MTPVSTSAPARAPRTADEPVRDYDVVEAAIEYLESNFRSQPSLADVASHVGMSEYHFQRVFQRWAGISPKRFVQYLTAGYARKLLGERRSVLDAAYAAGLSGGGRLHDLMVTVEAATPGEVKAGGAGLEIGYGVHPTPFGDCLLGVTPRGVCGFTFLGAGGEAAAVAELGERWPAARLRRDQEATGRVVARIFSDAPADGSGSIRLFVKGTNFQIKVWEALLRIPMGAVASYGDVAAAIGRPRAVRAVGTAVGSNPVAYLIPCHRVIRGTGEFGNYGGGVHRKRAMLVWENGRAEG